MLSSILHIKTVSWGRGGYMEIHTQEGCYYKSLRPRTAQQGATQWLL